MAPGGDLPEQLPGISERHNAGEHIELTLQDESARRSVLNTLAAVGDVEHFETIRPTLHDIFVQIARPDPDDDAPGATDA